MTAGKIKDRCMLTERREQIHSFQVLESSFEAQTSIYDSLQPAKTIII